MRAIDYLKSLDACAGPDSAMEWVLSRPKARRTLAALWADCPRGDWMLWLAGRVPSPDLDGIVAAAHACAMLAHDYAAFTDSYFYAASASASASADDAYAADAAASAAASAAADAAASAAAADADDTWKIAQHQCADLVRLLVRRPRVEGVR